MKHRSMIGLSLAALSATCLSCVLTPALAIRAEHQAPDQDTSGPDSRTIEVTQGSTPKLSLLDPDDRAWESAQQTTVPLFKQSISQPYGGGSIGSVKVSAIKTTGGIAIRLQWNDESKDDATSHSAFKDAAAVQFPIANATSLAMGHPLSPVAIWHWLSEKQEPISDKAKHGKRIPLTPAQSEAQYQSPVEELVAAGFSNRAPQPDHLKTLCGNGTWKDNQWSVVFFKPDDGSDAAPVFDKTHKLPVAFAIWNGSAGDRLGMKSISNWSELHFGQY